MTPPMDHEARAREIVDALSGAWNTNLEGIHNYEFWDDEQWDYIRKREADCMARIASALREERDRALEEAATLCMKGSAYLPTCCSRECYENSRVIRALKDKA